MCLRDRLDGEVCFGRQPRHQRHQQKERQEVPRGLVQLAQQTHFVCSSVCMRACTVAVNVIVILIQMEQHSVKVCVYAVIYVLDVSESSPARAKERNAVG